MTSASITSAIEFALAQNWVEAIKINKEILKKNKEDIDTLNRLAFAYTQTDEFDKAKKIYRKILTLDKYNKLALKNLSKINSVSSFQHSKIKAERVKPGLFIEEPGKTKVVQLINLAPNKILSQLNIGDTVIIYPKKHSVEIRNANKDYFGALPDDISFRMIKFISAGNSYIACVKNIQKNSVSIFIRELSRGKKFANQATFVASQIKEFTPSIHKEIKKAIITDESEMEDEFQEESDE